MVNKNAPQIYACHRYKESNMPEQPIKFQYQEGVVTGGYSFSAQSNIIKLSGYVQKLENRRVCEAIQYEAQKARFYYVEEVKRVKAAGGKVNNVLTKYEAVKKAKEDTRALYADVWSEVEDTYKITMFSSMGSTADNQERNKSAVVHLKNAELILVVAGPDSLSKRLIEVIEAHDGATPKVADSS
jgi:hypothetical protein